MRESTEYTPPIEERRSLSLMQLGEGAAELERNLIGYMMDHPDQISEVGKILNPDDISTEHHRKLFELLLDCYVKYKGEFSQLQVLTEIALRGLGGMLSYELLLGYSIDLVRGTTPLSLAKSVFEVSMARRMITYSGWVYELCISDETKDIEQLVAQVKERLDQITSIPQFATETVRTVIQEMQAAITSEANPQLVDRLTTGNIRIDEFLRLMPKEYIVIAARQKSGKTKLLIWLMCQLLQRNPIAVYWVSIEDDRPKIIRNMVAVLTGISIKKLERNELTSEQRKSASRALAIIEGWDLEIHYGKPTVQKTSMRYQRFLKTRKGKFCVLIYDNFNGAADVEPSGINITEKSSNVAGSFQSILTEGNQDGNRTMLVVLDHLKKDYDRVEGERTGYRPNQSDLISSERKLSVLTQLIMVNKPGIFKTFVDKENKRPVLRIGGKDYNRKDILKRLLIIEMNLNRNDGTDNDENDALMRFDVDLGDMQFHMWPKDQQATVHDTDVLHERNIVKPKQLSLEVVRDEFFSLYQRGKLEQVYEEMLNHVGNDRGDGKGKVTFDFLITRYKEYLDYMSTLQAEKYTKKENTIEEPFMWLFQSMYNNRYIKVSTPEDATRDGYLYNMQ